MRRKIALIGGGQIGQILAMLAAQKELGDIVILEIPELENLAKGKALDLMEMAPHGNYDSAITATSDYKDIAGADVIIITAGRPRQAGMTREDLLAVNLQIISTVAAGVKQYAPKAFCIIVTNPLDAMVYAFSKLTDFPGTRSPEWPERWIQPGGGRSSPWNSACPFATWPGRSSADMARTWFPCPA